MSCVALACGAIFRLCFRRSRDASTSRSPVPSVRPGRHTEGNQRNEVESKDDTVPSGSSGTPPDPAGTGARTPSESNPADIENGHDSTHDVAKIAWNGFQLISRNLESILEGTPFATPLAVLNTLIKIGNSVVTNKAEMGDLVDRTKKRLEMIDAALLKTGNDIAIERMERFARALLKETVQLNEMRNHSVGRWFLESDEDGQKVKEIFIRLDECTKDFHIDICMSIERQTAAIFDFIQRLHLVTWPRSRQAIYNADVDSMLTRMQCTQGTRTNIIDGILKWVADSSSPSVYWLNGLAGTGKSTIAYTICKHAEEKQNNILVASFFCPRQIEDARDRKYIIPTIVHQLARRSRSYSQFLLKADFDAVDSSERQMWELLVGPWGKSASERLLEFPPSLVVVDALDECEDGSGFLGELLDVIQKGVLPGLKFLVTSRPDPKIVSQCKSFPEGSVCRLHEVDIEEVKADVRTYLTKELSALHQTHKPQFKELVEQAGGLFIYAATTVRHISPGHLSENEQAVKMEELVKADHGRSKGAANPYLLDSLYREVLRKGLQVSHGEAIWRRRLLILHTILGVWMPTGCVVISDLLSTSDTDIDSNVVQHVVDDLHAVLYVSGSEQSIYWHHKSFLDFMQDPERAWLDVTGSSIPLSYNPSSQNIVLFRAY